MKALIPFIFFSLFFTNSYTQQQSSNLVKGSRKKMEFINNTGREVNDLHIVATVPVSIDVTATKFDTPQPFQQSQSTNQQGETITSFDQFKLGNKKKAIIWLQSDSSDIQIKKWWWTFDGQRVGPEKNGTVDAQGQRDPTNQDRDLVGHEEEVSGYKFKNPVKKPTKRREFGVNDLHLITLKKPVVVNAEKKDEQDTPKVGGKFPEDQNSITECDCTQNYNARTDRSCYELCKMEQYKGIKPVYIVNLKADKIIPYDSAVIVKLKGRGKIKIEEYFWTREGKPIDLSDSGEGRIRRENDHRGSLPQKPLNGNAKESPESKEEDKHMEEISDEVSCFNRIPHRYYVSRPKYSVGISAGAFSGQSAKAFDQEDLTKVQETIFEQAFMELVQKKIFPDEFSSDAGFSEDQFTLIVLAEFYAGFRLNRRLKFNSFARIGQQTHEAKFNYLYHDFQQEGILSGQGDIRTEIHRLSLGAGMDYFPFQKTKWEPFIGIKAGYQSPLSVSTEINLEGYSFPLEKAKPNAHAFGGGYLGIQYHLPAGYAVGLTLALEYHLLEQNSGVLHKGAGVRISKNF